MTFCNVIILRKGVVSESFLFSGEDDTSVAHDAEQHFIAMCKIHFGWGTEQIQLNQMEDLDAGYAEAGSIAICLTWPTVNPVAGTSVPCDPGHKRYSVEPF